MSYQIFIHMLSIYVITYMYINIAWCDCVSFPLSCLTCCSVWCVW